MSALSALDRLRSSVGERPERVVLAATGLLGILFSGLAFRSVPSFEEDFARFRQAEQRGIAAWRAVVTDTRARKLPDAAVADRIEREVLPLWREARRQAAELEDGPWAARVAPGLADVFRRREEAWEAMVVAGRTGDSEQSRRAKEAWLEADRLLAELRQAPARR